MRGKWRLPVLLLLAGGLLLSGYKIVSIVAGYQAGAQEYAAASAAYVTQRDLTQAQPAPTAAAAEPTPESAEPTPVPRSIPDLEIPFSVDFEALRAVNPDVVGWILSPDTVIDYPVMQGRTNDDYLHHTLSGEYNAGGSIFMSSSSAADLSDRKTLIYGHHMKNGSMFAALGDYAHQDYYEQHPYLWLSTPGGDYCLCAAAGYVTGTDDPAYDLGMDEEAMRAYLEYALERSDFTLLPALEDVSMQTLLEEADRLVVLSTCSYERADARYVLVTIPLPVFS